MSHLKRRSSNKKEQKFAKNTKQKEKRKNLVSRKLQQNQEKSKGWGNGYVKALE